MRKDRQPPSSFDLEVAGRLRELRKEVQERTGRAVWEIAAGARMSEQSWFQHERAETGITLAKLRELAAGLQMEPHDVFEKLFPVRDASKSSSFDPRRAAGGWVEGPHIRSAGYEFAAVGNPA